MSIKIGWTPCGNDWDGNLSVNELFHETPELVKLSELVDGDAKYCPSIRDFYKNVYAIRMPWNVTIAFTEQGTPHFSLSKSLHKVAIDENFSVEQTPNGGCTIQIMLNNMFVSDTKNVLLENMPPILHGVREEIIYLNGMIDIYSWQRSLHFGFHIPKKTVDQCIEDDLTLDFKKGEVVQYFRVRTPNGESTQLVELGEKSLPTLNRYAKRCELSTRYFKAFNLKEVLKRVSTRRPKEFIKD
jgi:hypothetical protein